MIKKIVKYLFDRKYRELFNCNIGVFNWMDDEPFIKKIFYISMGKELNIVSPKSFNEKLQWLKLYDRKPEYTIMVDKYKVRDYITEKLGGEYLIPLIGVWDSADEIDFESLPGQFVLKCNHNSGTGMCICTDKSKLNLKKVKRNLKKGLRENYYLIHREWPYKDVPRKIIAEQYMKSDEGGLTDYKIHCFNGVPEFILVCRDRFSKNGLTEDFFSTNWEHMPVKRPEIPQATEAIPIPEKLSEMLEIAKKLSENIPFLRVDLYCISGKIYFSELTFFPASGLKPFEPMEWDEFLGQLLQLPEKN